MLKKEALHEIARVMGVKICMNNRENLFESAHVHLVHDNVTTQLSLARDLEGNRLKRGSLSGKRLKAVEEWLDQPDNYARVMNEWDMAIKASSH